MRNKRTIFHTTVGLLLIVVSLLFTSCYQDTLYYRYHKLPGKGWYTHDTLNYQLDTPLSAGNYTIEFGIRHSTQYSYCDLWLGMRSKRTDSLSTIISDTDTLHINLVSEQGHWKGNSSGGLFQYTHPALYKLTVTEGDSLRSIQLFHIMKDAPLKGLTDVGIRIFQDED